MNVSQEPTVNLYSLINAIERFVGQNQHSSDVDTRWFTYWLDETLRIARQVRSGGLDPEYRAQVTAFRAKELEDQIERRRRELDGLERDLKKVKAA